MKGNWSYGLILGLMLWAGGLPAEENSAVKKITITGRKEIVVTTPTIRLGDLAEVTSRAAGDEEVIIGLQKINIDTSPRPGKESAVSATHILERLNAEGINLAQVGYILPRSITVRRAGRAITEPELRQAIEEELRDSGTRGEITLKQIQYNEPVQIAPGTLTLAAQRFALPGQGQLGFSITARVPGNDDVRFNVTAAIEEWREIPVARRPVLKGRVVGIDDLAMARLNMNAVPRDAALEQAEILGLEVSSDLNGGEIFRRNKLAIPAVIDAGSKVTVIYRRGLLEATASGIALEPGIIGQEVRIRNDTSKKVVSGTVTAAGIVEVRP